MLARHFLEAEATGREGHGVRRIEWLETWPDLRPDARWERVVAEPGYERWDGGGALGYLVLNAVVESTLADPPARRAARRRGAHVPDGHARPLGAPPGRRRARRGADRDLAAPPRPSRGRPEADGDEPARDRDPVVGRPPGRRRRLDGEPDLRRRPRRQGEPRTTSRRSAASTRTRRSRSRSGCSCSSTRSRRTTGSARCCSSRGRRAIRCRRSARWPPVCACPAIADPREGVVPVPLQAQPFRRFPRDGFSPASTPSAAAYATMPSSAPLRIRSIARCTGQTMLSSGRRSARFSSASGSSSSPSHSPPTSRRTTSPT